MSSELAPFAAFFLLIAGAAGCGALAASDGPTIGGLGWVVLGAVCLFFAFYFLLWSDE